MRQSTHIDMTKLLAEIVGWDGPVDVLARCAADPDNVRVIEVEGYGAHLFGHNLAALTHFCRPVVTTEQVKYIGYSYSRDRSLPHLDLTDRKIVPRPENWGPIVKELEIGDPLSDLVKTLTDPNTKGSIEADEITFPTAATMTDWAYRVAEKRKGNYADVSTVTGWILHWIEDCCIPHHAEGVLFDGHTAFEADLDDMWRKLRSSGKAEELVKSVAIDSVESQRIPRMICQSNSLSSQCAPSRLRWYKCFWRPGWNKLIKCSIERACRTGIEALRFMKSMLR